MAYIIGDDPSHGIVAAPKPASTPKPSYWRTLPIGPNYRYRTSPQIPDEEDALGRKAYINHVYNGLVEGLQTLAVHPIAALRRCSLPTVTTGNAQAALPARSV